ncbi:MAG: N-acetylmuramoyl-L-alanine amidase [Myxococcota bacterium]|nr:N-acetylmuramoyl-L-alanine amidase [Myxococcota bacterium]
MARGRICASRFHPLPLAMALVLLLPALLGADRPPGLGDVRDVRTWSYPDYTRVVIELTRPIDLEADPTIRLPADPGARRPERLYVDLPGVWVGRRYAQGVPVGDGLLQGVRLGQNTRTTSRLVIDLERYDRHRMFTLRSPDRVVIDVYGEPKPRPAAAEKPAPNGATGSSRLSMESRRLRTVVIDPGHGGKDPGAVGLRGIQEKDVNLKLAHMLARRLRARSFKVVLTRSNDRFIDLEERTALAESAGGDVFVSIHSNASSNRGLRGIEIYYLDEENERHNVEVAARENGVRPDQVDTLQETLARLRVAEASRYSRALADHVHRDVTRGLSQTYGKIPDLGVKRGPFYVLFMSSMPAILVEAGFLTNPKDARLLSNDRYLDAMAAQIAAGLGHYRNRGRERAALGEAAAGGPGGGL